jgi:hypothetical protein
MSVSSSHGFTSKRTDDLPAYKGVQKNTLVNTRGREDRQEDNRTYLKAT